jgi:6-methylpretetramide 4-monooxygenase / 4-hydroxy-6-methylpretetramide 12a-monooxygenase
MPQWRTEEILADQLTALEIEDERGVIAQEITTSENEVQVECVDKKGRAFVIHADYLVGAGRAHSPVRGAFHVSLGGIIYPRRYLLADVIAEGGCLPSFRKAGVFWREMPRTSAVHWEEKD